MEGFGNAIKYLYSQFILRDVLSFITPGTIVVLTAFLLFLPEPCLGQRLDTLFRYSRDIHWLLYIPLFGIFYMVGFAVQCFGEAVRLIYSYRDVRVTWSNIRDIFRCRWRDIPNPLSFREEFDDLIAFWQATERNEGARQGRERLVIMKQMCGNGFLAIVIASFLLLVDNLEASLWFLLVPGIPLLISIWWGHRVYVLRQDAREQSIIMEDQRRRGR